MDIAVKDGRIVGVRGRADDRTSRGRLGPKGLNGWEANHSPDRLARPLIRRGGRFREASWDEAMDLVVRQCREIRDRFTSGAIGNRRGGHGRGRDATSSAPGPRSATSSGATSSSRSTTATGTRMTGPAPPTRQAAQALRDREMIAVCRHATEQTNRRIAWLRTRIDQAAPQAVVVPS
jgi:anaerobic selenocysteine-containing dehydrogenase